MARTRVLFAVSVGVIALGVPVAAQPLDDDAAFRAWFDRVVRVGLDNNHLDGVRISYRVETPRPDAKPEDRATTQSMFAGSAYERRDVVVWRQSGMWRFNTDHASRTPPTYNDLVWGDGVAWSLSPGSLVLVDPANAEQTGRRYGLPGASSGFSFELSLVLNGGLGLATLNKIELTPRRTSTTAWTAGGSRRGERGETMTVNSRGTWDPKSAWGTVSDMTLVNQRASGSSGLRVTTSHWSLVAAGLGLAASARAEDLSGKLDRSVSHAVGTPFQPSEFLALIRPPAETDTDPIRGRVNYRTILDLRGPAEVVTRLENGTRIVTETAPRPRRALEDRIRVLGWLVAGSALLLVGGVLIRRHALNREPSGT